MLRVPVDKITAGMILARPIPLAGESTRFLLQRDREIPLDAIPRLQELGVMEVWVRCRNLEFLEAVIDPELGERQRDVYRSVRRNFEAIMDGSSLQLDASQFTSSISELFTFLQESACGSILLQKLDAYDNYLMSHSTNVCYLALLLGMKLERYLIAERSHRTPKQAKDLQELGLGCILHDVGKMKTPPEILNKPSRLTDEEMAEMQKHPVIGFEMVKGRVPAAAAAVVLNHHQRFGGGGYPERHDPVTGAPAPPMQGKQIPIFCRIATVCDVFDAATTARCYSGAKLAVQALFEMQTYCSSFFDPVVSDAFYRIIPPFPIGQIVTLSSGEEAVVIDFNPNVANRPKVQVIRDASGHPVSNPSLHERDLAIYCDLDIVSVNETDVRPFLQPQAEAKV